MSSENENKKETTGFSHVNIDKNKMGRGPAESSAAGRPVRKSKFEGRENLLLGKDEKDSIEKAVLERGTIEKEVIEKKEKKSSGFKEKLAGMDSDGMKNFLLVNYKYIVLAVLFIALIIVLVTLMSGKSGEKKKDKETGKTKLTTQISDTLEVDLYPEVNALVTKYLSAWAASDVNMLETMVSPFNAEAEKSEIALNKDYIESMNNIKCYTKPGPVKDSYIVYAYYEMKFKGVATLAPGLVNLFVFPTEDKGYYIWDYKDYIVSGSDVNTLLSDVNTKYDEAIASDEQLKDRVEGLAAGEAPPEPATEAPTEAPAQPPAEATQPPTEAPTEAPTQPPAEAPQPATDQVYVNSNVNVRAGASESAEKIGVIISGKDYTRVGQEGDWSIIQYNGGTGYVKTEFLHVR